MDRIDPTTLKLGDAVVLSLAWPDDFTIAITMRFFHGTPVGKQATGTLVCHWPRSVRIDFSYDVHSGAPFTWDVGFTALDEGGWRIALEASDGGIDLECSDLWMELRDESVGAS